MGPFSHFGGLKAPKPYAGYTPDTNVSLLKTETLNFQLQFSMVHLVIYLAFGKFYGDLTTFSSNWFAYHSDSGNPFVLKFWSDQSHQQDQRRLFYLTVANNAPCLV